MTAQPTKDEPRIGVFVCDCGLNIAGKYGDYFKICKNLLNEW